MRAGSVVVIIPTLNEQDSIADVVRAIPRPPVDRIIVADGPSSDATDPRAAAAGAEVIKVGRGYGRACAHDFVIGSRVRGEREPGSMAWHQVTAGFLAGALLRGLYGVRYTDMCAFRAIRREQLLRLRMREMTYGWNIEMQMRAARAGLRILEIPVPYRRRSGGTSKVAGSLSGTLRAATRIVATIARIATETQADRTQPMRERDA
jgi:glycosyltransferase involved in cell wall biosynthesis